MMERRVKVKIHPTFCVYLASIALLSSWQACLAAMAALFVHELSHYLVSVMLGERMDRVELTPFGGVMTYEPGKSPSKGLRGIAVSAAGPAGNYLFIAALSAAARQGIPDAQLARQMILANTTMLVINLLPALPLDGGRILFSAGYYLFGVSGLVRCLSLLGVLAGAGFLALGLYGMICLGILNLSLLIVGGYLMICAAGSQRILLAENLYTVVQERSVPVHQVRRMALYRVPENMPLHALVEPMARSRAAAFIYEDADGEHWIGEREICQAMLKAPAMRIGDIILGSAACEKRETMP